MLQGISLVVEDPFKSVLQESAWNSKTGDRKANWHSWFEMVMPKVLMAKGHMRGLQRRSALQVAL